MSLLYSKASLAGRPSHHLVSRRQSCLLPSVPNPLSTHRRKRRAVSQHSTSPLLSLKHAIRRDRHVMPFRPLCPALVPLLVGPSWDGRTAFLKDADVVVILEADIPWMFITGARRQRGDGL